MTKHIVCYSGGHSSGLVAIEVVRKYGKDNVILLNHDINPNIEDQDIKRFKREVADYLGIPITYANHPQWDTKDQFDVCVEAKAFQAQAGHQLCTNRLKTAPFMKYLQEMHSDKDCVLYYGFDANETKRIQRRSGILGSQGYRSDYPLALWAARSVYNTLEIGINPPLTYDKFKHANCTGCIKAGRQHWYLVYQSRPDIWEKAKWAEEEIGYSIIKEEYLAELEPRFKILNEAGVTTTEREDPRTFFARARRVIKIVQDADEKPCECIF